MRSSSRTHRPRQMAVGESHDSRSDRSEEATALWRRFPERRRGLPKDVPGSCIVENGAKVQLAWCNGGPAQEWVIEGSNLRNPTRTNVSTWRIRTPPTARGW